MAARFLVKRLATVNVSRTQTGDFSGHVLRQVTSGINQFSTAFKKTEGTESMRDDRHYTQGSSNANDDRSTSSYVADKAKEGVRKATDAAVNAGDNMKDTVEGAWKTAKETGQNITEAVADGEDRIQEDKVAVELKDVSQPVDTTEYRGVEDLHQQTAGENKSP